MSSLILCPFKTEAEDELQAQKSVKEWWQKKVAKRLKDNSEAEYVTQWHQWHQGKEHDWFGVKG